LLGRMAKARKDAGAYPVTFFYYSGHGVNVDGTNFILPTDIPGASPDDIRDFGVSFEQIFNRVSTTVAPTSFIVFDACRTVMDDQSRGLMRAYSPVGWASGV
ncbi:caspase family protein, partial [Hyphomonas sp. UBA5107]